jgi:hypothetical protein
MKMTLKSITVVLALLLLSSHGILAVSGLRLTVEGNDVHLVWDSLPEQAFIVGYRPTLDPSTPWTIIANNYPASSETNTTFVHAGVVVYPAAPSGGGGGGDPFAPSSASASEGDSKSDEPPMPPMPWDERFWLKPSSDTSGPQMDGPDDPDPQPLGSMGFYFVAEYEPDIDGDYNDPLPPLTDGLVLSGQYDIYFTPDTNYANILGPMLFCNNYVTADGLVTTEPEPGHLRLNWNSTFIQYDGGFFAPFGPNGPQPNGPDPEITDAERLALRDAFGEGTDMDLGRISKPNQAKVDQLPEHVLDYYQKVAGEQLRKDFQVIQEINTGVRQPPPGVTVERYVKIRMNSIHTQFTRMQSVNSSLFRRFGRAINRVLPFLGGIIILANADSIAADFLSAMQDYARDILRGDDETGSAAILAGRCNDLAPGSGNIVLNYLLR